MNGTAANPDPRVAGIEPLLTTDQCAALASVQPETILEWVADGTWPDPIINRPRCKRWNPEHVRKFLATGRVR